MWWVWISAEYSGAAPSNFKIHIRVNRIGDLPAARFQACGTRLLVVVDLGLVVLVRREVVVV
jgi:hypothetical protein